jgi:hypothetical protein
MKRGYNKDDILHKRLAKWLIKPNFGYSTPKYLCNRLAIQINPLDR